MIGDSIDDIERIVDEHEAPTMKSCQRVSLRRLGDALNRMLDFARETGSRGFGARPVPVDRCETFRHSPADEA
jgi:hypothetical protein